MTYSELVSKVSDWLHRSDLVSVIPTFIELTEEQLNRDLRVRAMEVALPATAITDNRITLADNVVDVKTLWIPGFESNPLIPQSFESVLASGPEGLPTMYAHQGADLYLNGGGSIQGVLYQAIPALTATDTTNWLSTKAPSVYLWGALLNATIYTKADPSVYLAKFNEALDALKGNEQRLTGPLVARAR